LIFAEVLFPLEVFSSFATASYPAFETLSETFSISCFSDEKILSSYSTDIVPAKRFTGAFVTPSIFETAFSTLAEQAAQDIPFTQKETFPTLHHQN